MTNLRLLSGPTPRALAAAALAATLALAACDTNARFNVNSVTFDQVAVLGAYPAVAVNGDLVRQCGDGPVDGFLIQFDLLSTARKAAPGQTSVDRDRSIRPEDIINTVTVDGTEPQDIKLSGTTNIGATVDCVSRADEPVTPGSGCQGTSGAGQQQGLHYQSYAAKRGQGANVLLLVDMSGSIKGLVDATTAKENNPDQTVDTPASLIDYASDYTSVRITAVREIISDLNPEDRYGVVAFGEGLKGQFLQTPCDLPEVENQEWDVKLDACFGIKNDDYWNKGIQRLQQGGQAGRANLWHAVDKAYDFLLNRNDLKRPNHIIVLTDGPDTCTYSESFGDCQDLCGVITTSDDVLNRISGDAGQANVPQIHVSFVQFESKGYRGPDPRQMEASCLSGGHYRFVNSTSLPTINSTTFRQALRDAAMRARYALSGFWQLGVSVPAFKSDSAPPSGTPRGAVYALQGLLTVKAASNLVGTDDPSNDFSGGTPGVWDERLYLRKTCSEDADCGAPPDADTACRVYCSPATHTCLGGAAGQVLPNNTPCADGSGGLCCDGQCLAPGSVCDSCQQ